MWKTYWKSANVRSIACAMKCGTEFINEFLCVSGLINGDVKQKKRLKKTKYI